MIKQLAHAVAYLHDSGEWNIIIAIIIITMIFNEGVQLANAVFSRALLTYLNI